ncbi:MAG: undecaprenyl-diphosphate phosphatase [Dehalococcoidia bacterium]
MLEEIVLGIIQGIAEWLPVSSEGLIVLAKRHLFGSDAGVDTIVQEALLLHLGTFFAALIYLRKDVVSLLGVARNYRSAAPEQRATLRFLTVATIVSGLLGVFVLVALSSIEDRLELAGQILTAGVGVLLIGTAVLQLRTPESGHKLPSDLRTNDDLLLGVVQGLAVLPGLSRSGLTVSSLLLRGFEKEVALRLSFLMSLPIVLGGNVVLNLGDADIGAAQVAGIAAAFVFGLLTIDLLLRAARRFNFGYFVLAFGVLVIASAPVS